MAQEPVHRRTGVPRALRWIGTALAVLLAVYLVGRAVVEVVTVDPTDAASYRDDWGGPTYPGVMAVHVLPGALLVVAGIWWWRRRRTTGDDEPAD
jgi:hypothetical protein